MIIIITIPLLLAELSRTRSALRGAPWIKFGKLENKLGYDLGYAHTHFM